MRAVARRPIGIGDPDPRRFGPAIGDLERHAVPIVVQARVHLEVHEASGWYDLAVTVEGSDFEYRLAGHLENGEDSISDPLMGGLV
jgi:phospholipase C